MKPPRHLLLTGAAGAIGRALAHALRTEWPELRLALLDQDEAGLRPLAEEVGRASVHAVDLAALDTLPGVVAKISAGRPLDGLINCAGIMEVRPLVSHDWAAAQRLLTVDLLAPLRLQELVVTQMIAGGGGVLVNVASMAGRVPLKGCTYYGAAKAGLAMASEIARAELAAHDIRVVTVYPGAVRSPLEAGARAAFGGALLSRVMPTGEPDALARAIVAAVIHHEPRVIYPRFYGVAWSAPNVCRWAALTWGPPPVPPA